jgi:lathosterol oxidase
VENVFLAAVLAAIVLAERLPRLAFERQPFLRPHFASDLFYLATSVVGIGLLLRAAGVRLSEVTGAWLPALPELPVPALWLVAIVLYDLGSYATHLLLHRSETLWRFHKVHHSSPRLDWLATFRGHAVEHVLRNLASSVLLLAAGFPASAVAVAATAYGAFAALNHSNLRLDLRWLEPVFVTPRLHRLHHVDRMGPRNLGTLFSCWDRLRGSLVTDPATPSYPLGVPGELESYPQSWLPQLVEPLRRREAGPVAFPAVPRKV